MKHLIWNAKHKHLTLYLLQRGRCMMCGGDMNPGRGHAHHPTGWTVEHVIPQAKGGGKVGNITLTHAKCNAIKGSDQPLTYMTRMASDLEEVCQYLNGQTKTLNKNQKQILHGPR